MLNKVDVVCGNAHSQMIESIECSVVASEDFSRSHIVSEL